LLYQADELSAVDRAEVQRRLTADAELAAQLESLEGTIRAFESDMARLDELPASAESVALRRIGKAMRQRMTEQLVVTAPPAAATQPKSRYPWWAYPLIGAAVIVISFVSWWGNRPATPLVINKEGPTIMRMPGQMPPEEQEHVRDSLQSNFEEANPAQPARSVASLNAAEDQIAELSRAQSDFRYTDGNE
jgi:hypothetical protein